MKFATAYKRNISDGGFFLKRKKKKKTNLRMFEKIIGYPSALGHHKCQMKVGLVASKLVKERIKFTKEEGGKKSSPRLTPQDRSLLLSPLKNLASPRCTSLSVRKKSLAKSTALRALVGV